MVYVLTVAVFLLTSGGELQRRDYAPPAPYTTLAECVERGREAAQRFGAIDGVAGTAWVCVPVATD
jgi:hypothetical protein